MSSFRLRAILDCAGSVAPFHKKCWIAGSVVLNFPVINSTHPSAGTKTPRTSMCGIHFIIVVIESCNCDYGIVFGQVFEGWGESYGGIYIYVMLIESPITCHVCGYQQSSLSLSIFSLSLSFALYIHVYRKKHIYLLNLSRPLYVYGCKSIYRYVKLDGYVRTWDM